MDSQLSQDTMRTYIQTMTKAKARTLKVLGSNQKFVFAMNTEIGMVLMQDLINKHEDLLDKVGNLTATDQQKTEYKVVHELIVSWSEKINSYYRQVEEINKEVSTDANRE